VTVPPQWGDGYPKSNEDYHRMFQLLTMEGWAGIGDNWDAMDARMKDVVVKTTAG
jgi:hypothetical protein